MDHGTVVETSGSSGPSSVEINFEFKKKTVEIKLLGNFRGLCLIAGDPPCEPEEVKFKEVEEHERGLSYVPSTILNFPGLCHRTF